MIAGFEEITPMYIISYHIISYHIIIYSRAAAVVRLTRSLLDPELFPHTAYVKIFATLARKTVN